MRNEKQLATTPLTVILVINVGSGQDLQRVPILDKSSGHRRAT